MVCAVAEARETISEIVTKRNTARQLDTINSVPLTGRLINDQQRIVRAKKLKIGLLVSVLRHFKSTAARRLHDRPLTSRENLEVRVNNRIVPNTELVWLAN
jgi:hypothetical protein